MAPIPPKSRVYLRHRRPRMACLPWLALGLLVVAFAGLLADATRDVRLKGRTIAAEKTSDEQHLTKRDPARLVSVDARRDGTASGLSDGSGGLLPRLIVSPTRSHTRVSKGPWDHNRTVPGALAGRFQPRAPPDAA